MTKGPKSSSVNKAIQDEELNTVVLISGLNHDYLRPLSNYLPDCLLPIASIPIIHYQISYLIHENFQRIIIYALSSSKLIEEYCRQRYSNLKIEVQNGSKSKNFGDIMRDLDSNQSIRNLQDFVIMPIDLFLTSSLMDMFKNHLARRERVSSCVMTFAFPNAVQDIFLQSEQIRGIAIRPNAENKLTAFERYSLPKCPKESRIESFVEDVHLVFCTKHIPPLFQDNFDYASFEDLIHGILINEEIIQYTMHVEFLNPASIHLRVAVDLPRIFDSTKILLERNLTPFYEIPPNYIPLTLPTYHLYRGLPTIYVSQTAKIHPSAKILGACMIGNNVTIGAGSILIDCCIGNDCNVGCKSRLRKVITLPNVVIGDNVHMDIAFICARAQILTGSKFERRVLVGPSLELDRSSIKDKDDIHSQRSIFYHTTDSIIKIGPNAKISTCSVIIIPQGRHRKADSCLIGTSGHGSLYSIENSSDEEDACKFSSSSDSETDDEDNDDKLPSEQEEEEKNQIKPWSTVFEVSMKLGRQHLRKRMSYSKSEEDAIGLGGEQRKSLSRQSIAPLTPGPTSADKAEEFLVEELRNTLDRCLAERIDPKNITLEVNSLKHAYAVLIDDLFFLLSQALLQTCLDRIMKVAGIKDPFQVPIMDFVRDFKESVAFLKPMLHTYFMNASDAQEICLSAIEDSAITQPVILKSGRYIIHILYDADVLSEESILTWNECSDLLDDPDTKEKAQEFRTYTKPFIEWLEEASSEEEEDEDD